MNYKHYYTYLIICTTGSFSGYFYFGQRKTNSDPYTERYKGSGKKLLDYYKKHPKDYLKIVLGHYNNEEELNKAEYDLIHPFLNHPHCLNINEGGIGGAPNEEGRKRISAKLMGHEVKQSTREKLSIAAKKQVHTQEQRHKQSLKMKGHKFGPCKLETKQKISQKLTGQKRSQESIDKQKAYYKEHKIECPTKGKHRVYDNVEHTKFHFE